MEHVWLMNEPLGELGVVGLKIQKQKDGEY